LDRFGRGGEQIDHQMVKSFVLRADRFLNELIDSTARLLISWRHDFQQSDNTIARRAANHNPAPAGGQQHRF
jgi:hypothetical protein